MSTVYSSWSSVAYGAGSGDLSYLKDPIDSSRNITLYITGDEFKFDIEVDAGTYNALGRSKPIVVKDVVKAARMQFTIWLLTAADEAAFDLLFESMRTLLLQLPDGRQWYIAIMAISKRLPPTTGAFLYIDVNAVEVDVPV
jgi:hypothetical protein